MPSPDEHLRVKAFSPFHVYFEGEATALSAVNRVGPFDVLPGHIDFFSLLLACEVIIDTTAGESVRFKITDGILSVRQDEVRLFANI